MPIQIGFEPIAYSHPVSPKCEFARFHSEEFNLIDGLHFPCFNELKYHITHTNYTFKAQKLPGQRKFKPQKSQIERDGIICQLTTVWQQPDVWITKNNTMSLQKWLTGGRIKLFCTFKVFWFLQSG